MSPSEPKAQIFNMELRALRRARAKKRVDNGKGDGFLLKFCGEIAAEKILDINREFKRAVIIGLPVFRRAFLAGLSAEKTPTEVIEFDDWPEQMPDDCHFVISGLVLQSLNDVPEAIIAASRALRPDGLFLAAILGGESLLFLRRACFAVDQSRMGGIVPRIAPMIDLQQAAGLLGLGGLALPVTDKDIFTVHYKSLETLVRDLRDIGEANCLTSLSEQYLGRTYLRELAENYQQRDVDGRFLCPYEILWMTGWKPHVSQQKSLKPGSAKMHLSDALKNLAKNSEKKP